MRFELGSSSSWPRFQCSQAVGQSLSMALHVADSLGTEAQSHTVSLDTGLQWYLQEFVQGVPILL